MYFSRNLLILLPPSYPGDGAAGCSKMFVNFYQTAWCHIPEVGNLHVSAYLQCCTAPVLICNEHGHFISFLVNWQNCLSQFPYVCWADI